MQTSINLVKTGFLALSFVLTSCDRAPTDEEAMSVRIEGVTAAIVNGEKIYLSDIELEASAQGLITPGDTFGHDHAEYQTILEQLIDQRLLAQESVRRRLDEEEDARHRLNAARERILGNILVESLVASDVTEDAIREMYAEQVRLQQLDDEVRISMITVADESTADTVRAEYANGAEFSALAFRYSIDTATRIEGGDLGYVNPADQVEPFASTIANTSVGDISSTFESETGWHILKVEDRRQRAPKTLEEMRPEIVTFLTYSQINQILRTLRTSAEITHVDPENAGLTPEMLSEAAPNTP